MRKSRNLLFKNFGLLLPSAAIIFATLPFDNFDKSSVVVSSKDSSEIRNVINSQKNLNIEDKEKLLFFYDNASSITQRYNLESFKKDDNSGFYDKNKILENLNKNDLEKSLKLMKDIDETFQKTNMKGKDNSSYLININKAYYSWSWGVQTWYLNNSDVDKILTALSLTSSISGVAGIISSAIGGPIGIGVGIGLGLFSGATAILREIMSSKRGNNGVIFKLLFGFIPISIQKW